MKNVSDNLQHRFLLASKTKVTVAKSGAKIALIKTQQKQKHKRVDMSVMTWGEINTKRYGNLPLAFSICLIDNIGSNNISSTIVKCFLITYPWWRHQMETFSTSLAICVGNSPVTKACVCRCTGIDGLQSNCSIQSLLPSVHGDKENPSTRWSLLVHVMACRWI